MDENKRIVDEFAKLLKTMAEDTETNSMDTKELLYLSKDQLAQLKKIAGEGSIKFLAENTDAIYESMEQEEKYNKEMIKKEEELSELSDEQLEKMGEEIFEGLSDVKETIEVQTKKDEKDRKKQEKNKKKEKNTTTKESKSETKRVDNFEKASTNLSNTVSFLSKESGLNKIVSFPADLKDAVSSEFSSFMNLFKTLVISPMAGLFHMTKGIGSMLLSPFRTKGNGIKPNLLEAKKSEKKEKKDDDVDSDTLEYLKEITDNTSKEKGMIKGRDLDLKKLIPDFRMPAFGVGGKLGGMLWKLAGAGMIIGGIYMAVQDFMDGFAEGGLGEGLYRAFIGKTDKGIMGSLKNAGKWALIGAGIGTFISPVVGTIAGGILGGAFGFAINSVAQIFESDKSTGAKIGESIFGKAEGGIMESVAVGGRWALLGAGIGLRLGGPMGAIAGGIIGFATGFFINFIHQILDPSIVSGLTKMFSWVGEKVGVAWDFLWKGVSFVFEMAWGGLTNWFERLKTRVSIAVDILKIGLSYVWQGIEWVAEKIGIKKYIDKFKTKISQMWTKVKDTFTFIIDWISNIGERLWDSFKTVMGQYWDRIKKWAGVTSDDNPIKPSEKVEEKTNRTTKPKTTEKKSKDFVNSGIETAKSMQDLVEETEETKETTVKENKVSKDLNKMMKDLNVFLKGDMLKKLESYFTKSSEFLANTLFDIQQEDRMWAYQMNTGSLSGYGSKVRGFGEELKKIEKGGTKGYETKMKEIRQNTIDNSTSIVTNNSIIDGDSYSLRKKSKPKKS